MKKIALSLNTIQGAAARASPDRALDFVNRMSDRANSGLTGAIGAKSTSTMARPASSALRAGQAADAALKGMQEGAPAVAAPVKQMALAAGASPTMQRIRGVVRGTGQGFKQVASHPLGQAAITGGALLGTYGLYKGYQHLKNRNKPTQAPAQGQPMPKIGSVTVLAFMDEMEKIADTGPNMFVESMKARASRRLSHVPDIARNMGARAVNWAKKQPGEIVQGLRQGAGAVASPVEAVRGGLSKKVSPLRELFSPAQGSIPGITTPTSNILQNATLGRLVSGGLAARGLYQSGKGLVGAVKDKEDPTGRGRSRLARGLEAGGHLAGSLAGAYAGRNLGAFGGMAAGIIPQAAGALAGRAAGAGVDRLRGHRAQPQQMG